MTLTVLDIAVAVIAILFLVRGFWVGFVRQIAFLAALFLGVFAAGRFHGQFADTIGAYVPNPQLGYIATYAMVFLVTYVVIMLLGLILKKVMQVTFLGWFDRTMGGVFGVIKAAILSTLLFMMLTGVLSNSSPIIEKSLSTKYLMMSSRLLASFIEDERVKEKVIPKKPAISTLLENAIPALQPGGGDAKDSGK